QPRPLAWMHPVAWSGRGGRLDGSRARDLRSHGRVARDPDGGRGEGPDLADHLARTATQHQPAPTAPADPHGLVRGTGLAAGLPGHDAPRRERPDLPSGET